MSTSTEADQQRDRCRCLVCQSWLPSANMRRRIDRRQDLLAVWHTITRTNSGHDRQTVCRSCFSKLEKCSTAKKTLLSAAVDARKALGLSTASINVTVQPNAAMSDKGTQTVTHDTSATAGSSSLTATLARKRSIEAAQTPTKRMRYTIIQSSARPSHNESSPAVQVAVSYPKGSTKTFSVRSKYKRTVISTKYNKSPYTVRTLLRSSLRTSVVKQMQHLIRKEVHQLCSTKYGGSLLRGLSAESLTKFKWKSVTTEIKLRAPVLYKLVQAAITRQKKKPCLSDIGIAIAVILKHRNKFLAQAQGIVSALLYTGHSSKQVFRRLNKLGLCLSHKQTLLVVKQLGMGYDRQVLEWKAAVENHNTANSGNASDSDDESWISEEDEDLESGTAESGEVTEFSSTSEGEEHATSDSTVSSVSSTRNKSKQASRGTFAYIIVGDNLDKTVKPRHTSSDHQSQSLHYFHSYVAMDRINFMHLSNDKPIMKVSKLPLSTFLPTPDDCDALRRNYAVLLGREVVRSVSYFKKFNQYVPDHITHEHTTAMNSKSVVIPVGVLPCCEQYTDEMVTILENLHKYVPFINDSGTYSPVPFGGDQLTIARATTAKKVRVTSRGKDGVQGLTPFCADWHAKVNFMQIMWKRLYKGGSSMEGGTLQQLRNLIGWRSIGVSTDVSGHVNDIEDFLVLVVRCHLVVCALHYFSMTSLSDKPKSNGFPANFDSLPFNKRKEIFNNHMLVIIDRYVIPKKFQVNKKQVHPQPQPEEVRHNPHLQRLCVDHAYQAHVSTSPVVHRRLPPSISDFQDNVETSQSVRHVAEDGVRNYASAVLSDGLLLMEFKDSIREGDGPRILRCWKALLLHFYESNHYNYAKEAVRMLATVNALGTPRTAAQITWSRVVNPTGQPGHNIPVDLKNEHLNGALKEAVSGVGANICQQTIIQCGKSLDGLLKVCDSFDRQHGLHPTSHKHSLPSLAKDEQLIIKELSQARVFDYVPGRAHRSFRTIFSNPAEKIDVDKLNTWLSQHKSTLQAEQDVYILYKHAKQLNS